MHIKRQSSRSWKIGLVCGGVVILALLGGVVWLSVAQPSLIAGSPLGLKVERPVFPTVDTTVLTDKQARIVTLLRQEYETPRPGTYYAEGVEESWCADFVSWIMKEADAPLHNPNSGSWRIPGTYTLREYYQSVERFQPSSSGYQPQVGDVVLYDNPGPFGQHTNIVVKNDHGTLTTVGGNENNAIRVQTYDLTTTQGVVGFGTLQ